MLFPLLVICLFSVGWQLASQLGPPLQLVASACVGNNGLHVRGEGVPAVPDAGREQAFEGG